MKLSIIIPCYNEYSTILETIRRVKALKSETARNRSSLDTELVVVDDGSTDGSRELLLCLQDETCRCLFHAINQGKGAAIRTALEHVTGDVVVIQDADLECHPDDLVGMFELIRTGQADVVYGSRFLGDNGFPCFWFRLGNRLLTGWTNWLFGSRLTDEATCYKMLRTSLLKSLNLKCIRFEFCPEVTAKLLRRGHRIVEVPIRYVPRGYREGKKLRWRDGTQAAWTLLRYRFLGG